MAVRLPSRASLTTEWGHGVITVPVKRLFKPFFPLVARGVLDYYRYPYLRSSWGGPFNGQAGRQELLRQILAAVPCTAIVETGAFRGTTTQFLAETSNLPVYTVELDERSFGFSWARFLGSPSVHVRKGDSRRFLNWLLTEGRLERHTPIFAYLDAHWGEDLPLAEELDLLFQHCPRAIAMIDDFQVQGDTGYGYDRWRGLAFSLRLIEVPIQRHGLTAFFPALPAAEETGQRRGCVVLCGQVTAERLVHLSGLRLSSHSEQSTISDG